MYVGTINAEPITYIVLELEDDAPQWFIGNADEEGAIIGIGLDGFTITAEGASCEVELIDMGPRFISVPALLQADTIHVEYPFYVLSDLFLAGCGLGLHVRSLAAGIGDGHSYAPIILYSNDAGDAYFAADIQIGNDQYTTWTVDPDTGDITGTTGGST